MDGTLFTVVIYGAAYAEVVARIRAWMSRSRVGPILVTDDATTEELLTDVRSRKVAAESRGRSRSARAQPAGVLAHGGRDRAAGWASSPARSRRGASRAAPADEIGRRTSSPPQFGQMPWNMSSAQSAQNVHSYVQILRQPAVGRQVAVAALAVGPEREHRLIRRRRWPATARQGAASRWPPSTGSTTPVTNSFVSSIQIAGGHVVGGADPAGGQRAGETVEHRLPVLGGHRVPRRRGDDPGRDRVHADRRELDGERAHERLDGAVDAAGRRSAAHRRHCGDAGDEHDRTADVGGLDCGERPPQLRLESAAGRVEVELTSPGRRRVRPVENTRWSIGAERRRTSADGGRVRDVDGDALAVRRPRASGRRLATTTSQPASTARARRRARCPTSRRAGRSALSSAASLR